MFLIPAQGGRYKFRFRERQVATVEGLDEEDGCFDSSGIDSRGGFR